MSDTIHAICLTDNDYGAFTRNQFLGAAKDDILPDWAKEKREILQQPRDEFDDIDR